MQWCGLSVMDGYGTDTKIHQAFDTKIQTLQFIVEFNI